MPPLNHSPHELADYFKTARELNGQEAMESHHKYFDDVFPSIASQQPKNPREAAALLTFVAMRRDADLTDPDISALRGVLQWIVEAGNIDLAKDPFDQFIP